MSEALLGNISEIHPRVAVATDEQILGMWCAGFDTLSIARVIGVPEADIYNKLPKVLERRRQDRDWHLFELPRDRIA